LEVVDDAWEEGALSGVENVVVKVAGMW